MATAKKLPSGNWRVLAYVGKHSDGSRDYKSFTAATKKDAEYQAALYSIRRKRTSLPNISIGEAIDRYIASKSAVLSPKTVREYKGIRTRCFQGIIKTGIDKLTDEALQGEVAALARALSPKTVRNAYALLVTSIRMFNADFKPTVTLPQQSCREVSIPPDKAVKALLAASAGTLKSAILLSAVLGLRRSEICALVWADIDLAKRSMRISKAMVVDEDRKWITKTTKTSASTRTLDIPQVVIDHLAETPHDSQRVVPATPDSITYGFISLRDRLGLTLRFHDLRHHYASTLLEMGIPDLYAMKRMGHATTNMLKTVYQHLKDEREEQIDREIDDKMSGMYK